MSVSEVADYKQCIILVRWQNMSVVEDLWWI